MRLISAVGIMVLILSSCGSSNSDDQNQPVKAAYTPPIHSFAQPNKAVVKHLNLEVNVDFEAKQLSGTATYDVEVSKGENRVVFDTRNLNIISVMVDSVESKQWWLGPEKPFMGVPLEVEVGDTSSQVAIQYNTTEGAEALQWLSPEQTADKVAPFLFTQSQAILARTWLPCQDSPGIRYTYEATVKVPKGLMAVMSAENPTKVDSSGVYHFKMEQPIPSYLMALAVGNLKMVSVGDITGVYAEPSVIDAAAYEFEDMQKMVNVASSLYGEYAWGRYDVLVLPPSFPFGGMENPRLTFATPTILAGDRSLTALVAHELAHSWSGNLVTNSTWNDFWLNEGFTVYFERRIMEAIYGKDYANMLSVLGWQDLQHTLEEFADTPDDTKLKLNLADRDPDDGMSDIAYEKGYFFLRTVEESVGREKFDTFLKNHFQSNAFQTMDTERFLENLKSQLLDGSDERYAELKVKQWVYEPGLPSNVAQVESSLFAQVEAQLDTFLATGNPSVIDSANWTTHQWLHFLRKMPQEVSNQNLSELDRAFGFTKTGNSEIAAEWYVIAIENDYHPADQAIEDFLVRVGRRKFLTPIYGALVKADPSLERARLIYEKARPNYHAVSVNTLDEMLDI
ncbi:MAG: M1 family metallopeptidase [Flavobacteriales bacterium]